MDNGRLTFKEILEAPSPSFVALAQGPMASTDVDLTGEDLIKSINVDKFITLASVPPPLSMVCKVEEQDVHQISGIMEAPFPYDNLLDDHTVPSQHNSDSRGLLWSGPNLTVSSGNDPHKMPPIVPDQPVTLQMNSVELNISDFGNPVTPSPERTASSVSPSLSPLPTSRLDANRGAVRVRSNRSHRTRASRRERLSRSTVSPRIPSSSNPGDVSAAVAELREVGISLNAPRNRETILAEIERREVKMLSQLAWKLFFNDEAQATLTFAEVKSVKKARRKAKGTVYAQNSRRKQAREKSRTSSRIEDLEAENTALKEEVQRLTALLHARQ